MAKTAFPVIWLVIGQSLLMRRYSSAAVPLEQLSYVADLTEKESVNLPMVPLGEPRHAGSNGTFRVITSGGA